MILALTGFMGCGKSTVARILAAQSGDFYFDLDDTIQIGEGCTISEIFASEGGEARFRELELEYLGRIIDDYRGFPDRVILSLGGGTVMTPACAELLKKNATIVYLRASVDELVKNLQIVGIENRPLLKTAVSGKVSGDSVSDEAQSLKERIAAMMSQRAPVYEKTADIILDIDGLSPEQIAELCAPHFTICP